MLNDKTQEIIKKSDQRNRQIISKENLNINQEWSNLINNLDNKLERLQSITGYWKEFDNKFSDLENSISNINQRYQHIDLVVKSKRQLEEVKNSIEVSLTFIYNLFYIFWHNNIFIREINL